MGYLSTSRGASGKSALPSGSFTVDREGVVIASTISSRFSLESINLITKTVLQTFSAGSATGLPLTEFTVRFGAMNIRAVEMRGGAMIFLTPRKEPGNRLEGFK